MNEYHHLDEQWDEPVKNTLLSAGADEAARLGRLTEQARQVVNLSQEEAWYLQHRWVGSEHLLLGLLRQDKGVAARVLTNVGLELNQVRQMVESGIGRGESIALGEIALNPRARKIITRAGDEAELLGEATANAGHLLLSLVREDAYVAASASTRGHMSFLDILEVNREDLRTQTLRLLSIEATDWPAGEH